MTKHHGYRSKTRRIFRKKVRKRGLPGLSKFMIEYKPGDKVDIVGDPSFQKRGFPHRRFHGETGVVFEERGRCYGVNFKLGDKMKTIFIGREHLRLNKGHLLEKEKK